MELICFYCGIQYRRKDRRKTKRNFCSIKCYLIQLKQEQSDDFTIIRHAYSKARQRSKREKMDFNLSLEHTKEVWDSQGGICALSGLPIKFADTENEKRHGGNSASIDRIDSQKGYIEGNIQYIHKDLQWMKSAMPEDKFIYLCRCIGEKTKDRKINWPPLDMGGTSGTMPVEATIAPRFDAEYYSQAF